jgi:dextranase
MKKIIYLVAAFLCLSCSDDHESNPQNGGASGSVTEVTPVTSDLCVELTTDKAFYKPNETVTSLPPMPCLPEQRYAIAFWEK